jgi:hypothetical protein
MFTIVSNFNEFLEKQSFSKPEKYLIFLGFLKKERGKRDLNPRSKRNPVTIGIIPQTFSFGLTYTFSFLKKRGRLKPGAFDLSAISAEILN